MDFDGVTAPVKLVIWDLDETFWRGTLSEEGVVPVEAHVAMIATLVDRGIMCSICSKNDLAPARAALERLGVWDLIVFPHVDWTPKGAAIAGIIAGMGLRAENVLFLDDNPMNRAEAQHACPGLMTVDGRADLPALLDLPQLAGRDDRTRTRLAQYRVMAAKRADRAGRGLSNLDFLRRSRIRVRIVTEIEPHMDRVLELLNRTNQLNFTKVRANTASERAALRELLATSGVHAGLVQVQDRYGDYGIVGFFAVRTKFSGTRVHHLVFSCRTLNMGVEQWIWAHLGRPPVDVAGPVASRLDTPAEVDWIREVTNFATGQNAREERRLCLVGGCDLLQVSFYCGTNRDEFVNRQDEEGMLVRYDDVGFFLNPRDMALKHSVPLRRFVGTTLEEMKALDRALSRADLILLSLFFSVPSDLLFTFGGEEFGGRYWATIPPRRFRKLMADRERAMRFAKEMHHRRLSLEERLALTRRCFARADALRRPEAPLFLLSAVTRHGRQAQRSYAARVAFNEMARDFCAATPGAHFVDIDALLAPEDFVDSDHYTRTGYFRMAEFVNATARALDAPASLARAG